MNELFLILAVLLVVILFINRSCEETENFNITSTYIDKNWICNSNSSRGLCTTNPDFMNVNCPATCNYLNKQCTILASNNACNTNKDYMSKYCPDSCDKKEIGLSQYILKNNWNINCIVPHYRNLDYRTLDTNINKPTEITDVIYKNSFFGRSLTPEEMVFYKKWRFNIKN